MSLFSFLQVAAAAAAGVLVAKYSQNYNKIKYE
jgi:hypothetical protein